jgi:hypothetical protein
MVVSELNFNKNIQLQIYRVNLVLLPIARPSAVRFEHIIQIDDMLNAGRQFGKAGDWTIGSTSHFKKVFWSNIFVGGKI